jgi:HEPN domain-containing protein
MRGHFWMKEIDRAHQMMAMAQKDLTALKLMKDNPEFADEIFGFHAQQAIEKSLKAWIATLNCDFPLTHNIITLLTLLEQQGRIGLQCRRVNPLKISDQKHPEVHARGDTGPAQCFSVELFA